MTQDSGSTGALNSAAAAGSDFAHSRTFEELSRAGSVARALIDGISGVLALKLALGSLTDARYRRDLASRC